MSTLHRAIHFPLKSLRGLVSSSVKRLYSSGAIHSDDFRVRSLVQAYRNHGHLKAKLDPLDLTPPIIHPSLGLEYHGFKSGAESIAAPSSLFPGNNHVTVSELINKLEEVYCGAVGFEFGHVTSAEEQNWFAEQIEMKAGSRAVSATDRSRILDLLLQSEKFDLFLQKKFSTVKRYGLEGAESCLPAFDALFSRMSTHGVSDVVMGTAHRGRLNMLISVCKYPARAMFWKMKGFSEVPKGAQGTGDVLSHIYTSVDIMDYGPKPLHVSVLPNPSHLEAVNPVAMGKARAKQDYSVGRIGQSSIDNTVCLSVHGDAAFAGQGVVAETLMMSLLKEYQVGGVVHLIVNNQIGFTTQPVNGRSSRYSSDVGKMVDIPVVHVNGDCPEKVVEAARLVVDYRQKFKKDIILDVIGYRRRGHNELDEPFFTQPAMYGKIKVHETVATQYTKYMKEVHGMTDEQVSEMIAQFEAYLEDEMKHTTETYKPEWITFKGKWRNIGQPESVKALVNTGCDIDLLKQVGAASVKIPENISIHDRLHRTHNLVRLAKLEKGNGLDWATCEALAFGSLLAEGSNVRISGQDVGRGTFSHRHVMYTDQKTNEGYVPLNYMSQNQGTLHVANSPLSEFGVLGFEYGYSLEDPNNLVIWEAQFGDFANGAQIPIDHFISSSEIKWLMQTGLVILVPHGYDGGGPEHSNSRPERYLQLCGSDDVNDVEEHKINMRVVNCTTPANYFHVLRRQMRSSYRKPLIVISPKVLLRHPSAVSSLDECGPGTSFKPVIPEVESAVVPEGVKKVIFTSGKFYYELHKARYQRAQKETAIVRVEEIAPFPFDEVRRIQEQYPNATDFVWCQEEPKNMGAWFYVEPRFRQLGMNIQFRGRPSAACSATGVSIDHTREQVLLLQECFH
eukprot:TRINITY_DN1017_c0_g1_i1.p1 TRINITY_DN1017_c0_g1~~TRINITY_DN1017_c0_g1_i1.p1  ORF type:complete len:900 (-),score=190.22 TRINITY_DN1017_c0_g1_i1:508-3207(-)